MWHRGPPSSGDSWYAAGSQADSSSIESLALTLPSVFTTPAIAACKPDASADLEKALEDPSGATGVTAPTSSRQARPRSRPASAWYTVGATEGAILCPHTPRSNGVGVSKQAGNIPSERTTYPINEKSGTTGTAARTTAVPSSSPSIAGIEFGPYFVALTNSHRSATAPSATVHTKQPEKRSRGGNLTSFRTRRTLSKRPTTSARERLGSSVPSKFGRVAEIDVEPIQNQLAVRRRGAVEGQTTACDGFNEELPRGRGAQAVCGRPLVPRPSSPRGQGECHPWHFSLDRFTSAEGPVKRSEPWRLEEEQATAAEHEANPSSTNRGSPPGPTPVFSTEQQGIRASLLARGRGQPEKDQRSGHAAAADDRKISSFGTPPQSSIVLPSESTERQSSPTSQLVPVGDSAQPGAEKVIIVTPAENLAKSEDAGDSQRRGTDRNDGWTQRPGGGQSGEDEELRTPLLRRRRVRSLIEGPYDVDSEMRLPNGQGHDGCPLDDQQRGTQKTVGGTTSVMPTSESPGEGKQGHCIEKGGGDEVGVSSSDGPGDVRESSRDETNKFPDSSEQYEHGKPKLSIDGMGSPVANTGARKRPMLGEAGAGAICVAESVMMGAGRSGLKQAMTKPKRRKRAEPSAPPPGGNEEKKPVQEECRNSVASVRKVSRKPPEKPSENPRIQANNMTIVDVALAAAQRNRDDRMKARAMLKNARLLISKGRLNRAHTVLCEAIVFGGAPNLLVVLHELRARVRTCLNMWADAREDVQVALRGLEQGEGDEAHDMDSEEERMEEANLSGRKRWRAIVNRVILRRRYAQASFSTIVSTFLAARRGLRARVMLVAAKCLAQEASVEEALICTREIRALAGRRSALPGGSSGVTSTVTHEAFKLEIQCLQESGQFAAAVVAAREMDAQVNRDINDQRMQNGKGSAANDANAKDQEGKTDTLNGGDKGNGLDSVLFADEETWNRDGEASYEASVWAKVAIADMTTRSIAHREDSGGKGKERDGNGRKGQSSSRKSKKEKRGKRAQQDDRIGEKERRRSGCVALQEKGAQPKTPALAATLSTQSPSTAVDPSIPATAAKAIEVGHQPQDPMTESRVELGVKVEVSSPTSQGVEKQIKSSMGSTGRHVDGGNAWNIYKDGHETKQRIYAQDESTRDAERATTSRAVGVSVETGGLMPIRAAVGDVSADRGFELAEKADLEVSDDVSDRAEKEERPTTRRGILLANGACDKQEPVCGMEAHDSDKDEKKDREEEADGFSKQAFVPENKEDQQDIHGGKKDKREEEGDDREEDEGDDEEEDEEDDEKEEETVKTDEEHRRELEAAIDPLKVLLGDERMAWRADIRTLRVLATGLERLADLSQENAEKVLDTASEAEKVRAETESEESRTRQEILETGGESLRDVFAALEGKLSSLVTACTPLWRAHCRAKNIPIKREKRARKGGDGGGRLRTRAKQGIGGDNGEALPTMVRELLVSIAGAGISIEECAIHSGPDLQSDIAGGGRTSAMEGPKPGSSPRGGTAPNAKHNKRNRLPKDLEEQLAQMLKVLSMIPVVLESRARLATLAGEDPDDTVMPLLESTIGYLCLPRTDPPGGASEIGVKVFGGGTLPPKRRKVKKNNSLRMSSAAVLAVSKRRKTAGNLAAGKAKGVRGQLALPTRGNGGDPTALSPSTPRQRSPSSSEGGGGGRQQDDPEQKAVATAAAKSAGVAAKGEAKAVSLLLPWDAESLASLLAAHRDVAAVLLRSERHLKLEAGTLNTDDQGSSHPRGFTSEKGSAQEYVKGSAAPEAGSARVDDLNSNFADGSDGEGEGDGDDHAGGDWRCGMLNQCADLLRRADDSLSVALAAAGCEGWLVDPLTTNDAVTVGVAPEMTGSTNNGLPRSVHSASVRDDGTEGPIKPRPPSRTSTPPDPFDDDDDGAFDGVVETTSPLVPIQVVPAQSMEAEEASNRDEISVTDDTLILPPAGSGGNDDGTEPLANIAKDNTQQQRKGRGSTEYVSASVAVVVVDSHTIAELYGMRCAAKEGLGFLQEAFSDCLGALAVAPKASKLWAKAASLALQVGSEIDRSWEDDRVMDGRGGSRKDDSLRWANEAMRLASGLLRLCPRSHDGFLFRGQAAERAEQYERAMRDYCYAQHIRPWSSLPLLLRARLRTRLGHLEAERPGGGAGEHHAAEAAGMIRAFLWSPCLPVDADNSGSSTQSRITGNRVGSTRIKALAVSWWKGRIEELERNHGAASECYEQVFEKEPTLEHLNRLASALLGATQPGRAYQVLSKFLDGGMNCVGASAAVESTGSVTEVGPEAALKPTPKPEVPSPLGNATVCRQAGYSTARLLRGRCLFVLGKDEQWTECFQAAYKGDLAQASVLYEWSLAEAISTCMPSAGSSTGGLEVNAEGPNPGADGIILAPVPILPAMTGIAAWDSALLQDYERRVRAREAAAAAAAAAAPDDDDDDTVEAEANQKSIEEAIGLSGEDSPSAIAWGSEGTAPKPLSADGKATSSDTTDDVVGNKGVGQGSATASHGGGGGGSSCAVESVVEAGAGTDVGAGAGAVSRNGNSDDHDDTVMVSGPMDTASSSASSGASDDDLGSRYDGQELRDGGNGNGTSEHEANDDCLQYLREDVAWRQPDSELGGGDGDLLLILDSNSHCRNPAVDEQGGVGTLGDGESISEGMVMPMTTGARERSRPRRRTRKRKPRGFDRALDLITRCIRKDRFNAKAYNLRAELQLYLGWRDRAIGDYRAAASLEVGNSRARMNMGLVHLNASRSGLAFTEFDDIERASKGSSERVLAAFNLGIAAATMGELSRAEMAFTRALNLLTSAGAPRDVAKLVTPAACLANRGLVRLVMKRFSDAAADLQGAPAETTSKMARNLPAICAGGAAHGGKGLKPTVASAAASATTTLAGGALDTFDCELGRALAEGWLEDRASREAAGNRMRKLLRSTRLLACEMASIRIGLGNLEATKGETGNSGNDFTPAAGGTDVDQQGGGNTGSHVRPRQFKRQNATVGAFLADAQGSYTNNGRAVRQFLHAIHACPTASAAWLNASEALETIFHHGGVSQRDQTRSVANQDGYSDSVAASRAGVPTVTLVPSLALVDAVLAMAPTHHTALRCRATTLARIGRTLEALIAADRSVATADNAVGAAKRKGADVSSAGKPASRLGQASVAGSDGCSRTLFSKPVRPAVVSRRHRGTQKCSSPAKSAVDAFGANTNTNVATGVATPAAVNTCSAVDGGIGGRGSVGRGGEGIGPAIGQNQFVAQGSIGFMRSSKATVVVGGGLLLTGGGRANAFDVAKSLVLRGCLRQKMGRRDQAEQDYQRALEVCRSRLHKIEENHVDAWVGSKGSHTEETGNEPVEPSRPLRSVREAREDRNDGEVGFEFGTRGGVTNQRKTALGGRGGQWSECEPGSTPGDATTGKKNGMAQAGCSEDPLSLRETKGRCEGALEPEDSSEIQEGMREVLKLKSLIHHNLASLHIAAVLGTDIRTSLRKEAIAREASEIEAIGNKAIATLRPASIRRRAQCRHEQWWSSTVLAVASMVSETSWAVPWRGNAAIYGNDDNVVGKIARFQLGSAEIASAISSGYDADDDKAIPTPLSLTGTARSRALLAVKVNLAAAEKIGALSGTGPAPSRPINQQNRRGALGKAIASLSSAITLSPNPDPKLYVERGGLFAMMDTTGPGKNGRGGKDKGGEELGGECANDYGKAAASDFATALWLDSHLQGRGTRQHRPAGETGLMALSSTS